VRPVSGQAAAGSPLVDIDQMFEMADRNGLQQLRKDCLALVHDRASSARKTGDDRAGLHRAISNRRNRSSAGKALHIRASCMLIIQTPGES
jgi:hypothetical protein